MYAVIKTGGKQQKVKAGDIIEIEHLSAEGETVTFHPLLVVDDDGKTHYGKDAQGAVVTAKLLGEQKGDKVSIFKYKNKSGYARRAGHRQLLTLIEIAEVSLGAAAKKPAAKKAAKAAEPAEIEAAEAPAEAPEE
jgi:large subunit ribosomal protein L21